MKGSVFLSGIENNPVIGVLPQWDDEKKQIWMRPGYLDGVIQAGGCPVVLPLDDNDSLLNRYAEAFDGFLFTGGPDIFPGYYNEETSDKCGEICERRDKMEEKLFKILHGMDKPIFGICRAIQVINVFLGGTLYQDIPSEYHTTVPHEQPPPYNKPSHRADIVKNSPLEKLLHADSIWINSFHHQAIKSLSPGLEIMAKSEDGIIEAVYMPGRKYLWAVQWHPEMGLDEGYNTFLFSSFVGACIK
jgi:putative glutamine amidotransferase